MNTGLLDGCSQDEPRAIIKLSTMALAYINHVLEGEGDTFPDRKEWDSELKRENRAF